VREKYVPTKFEVFSPKAIVTYKGLEDVLSDRSISIVMLRSENKDILNTEIDENNPIWEKIRNCLYAFALKNWREIRKLYNSYPKISFIEGRAWELWKPLLVLINYIYGEEETINFCLKYVKPKIEETIEDGITSPEGLLLTALSLNVVEDNFYTASEIKNWVLEIIKNEQGDEKDIPKWLTNDWIGSTLSKQFNIPRKKYGGKKRYYLTKDTIKNLCKKYSICLQPGSQVTQVTQVVPKEDYLSFTKDDSTLKLIDLVKEDNKSKDAKNELKTEVK
jgi:hypothetical protein